VVDTRREAGLAAAPVQARVIAPEGTPALSVVTDVAGGETCVDVPIPAAGQDSVVEMRAAGTQPIRVHLYSTDEKLRVGGVER
jgi:hypothetical protein